MFGSDAGAGSGVAGAVAQLDGAIDAVAAIDPSCLSRDEIRRLAVELHRCQARMDAQTTRSTGWFERYGDPQGAVTTQAWMAWQCRIKKSVARAEVARARALQQMPEVEAAYAAGEITDEHVRLLAAAQRSNPKAFAKAEDELVDDGRRLRFDVFARRVAYFRQEADPDGAETEALDAFERRKLHCSTTFEDTVQVDGLFDPIGGAVFKHELDRLERIELEADWREARERLGDAATAADLRRSAEQRRLDAAVEMAKRSAAKPADARSARYLLTVLVGYETFAGRICQLADGTVVTPGQVVTLLEDADVERVVFGSPSRVVDVGARQRLFVGGTRRAVEVRDLECDHESCDVPYERCEVDHIERWEQGGPTIQSNGRLRCPRHHEGRRRGPPPRE